MPIVVLPALLVAVVIGGSASPAQAALTCATTTSPSSPSSASPTAAPSPGNPCWVDYAAVSGQYAYPFGSDGNPVDLTWDGNPAHDPSSAACGEPIPNPYGQATQANPAGWGGDFNPSLSPGNLPCYLQVNSMAFRAWNRGLAATSLPFNASQGAGAAFGVWLYNGTTWFPDPAFPGSAACPGSSVLWAGKLDYWLIGPSASGLYNHAVDSAARTLCRFDGSNLVWEPLKLPAATIARLPVDVTGAPVGGITTGTCYAWNNCWFYGTDGIGVHWDGQVLTDAASGGGRGPWLQGDFTAAVGRTDASGNAFGLAVTKDSATTPTGPARLENQPDGTPAPQLYGSQGGPSSSLAWSPPPSPPGDPLPTDIVRVDSDANGDVWVAGVPSGSSPTQPPANTGPAPLLRLTEAGGAAACPGYDANTFSDNGPGVAGDSFQWTSLSVFASDGSALAGAVYRNAGVLVGSAVDQQNDIEPALVAAVCGHSPTTTLFRRPDPWDSTQPSSTQIPVDYSPVPAVVVAAIAANDAWAATTDGEWSISQQGGNEFFRLLRPHLYQWTDGQPPEAPAGDDNEPRPSLFTLDAPVYYQPPPTVVTVTTVTTIHKVRKRKTRKLKPAIYDVVSKVRPGVNGTFTLYLTFKVRRPVTIGLEALRGKSVVASSGLRQFHGHSGQLTVTLARDRWPTGLRFVNPRTRRR